MIVVIKGAGDLASGIAHRLFLCGFSVIMTELANPTTVRTKVSFSSCVVQESIEIEGVIGLRAQNAEDALLLCRQKKIAVLVDETAALIKKLQPDIVIDAIMAKKNSGTTKNDAPLVIALGPGFVAPKDCHAVIETNRGHYLGKVIYAGSAQANTGTPGNIGGYTTERIIRASCAGTFYPCVSIGDIVSIGTKLAEINQFPVYAQIDGVVRGILFSGTNVFAGMKSGDIDPREKQEYCFTISDKARSIAGGVLEAILHFDARNQ